MNPKSNLIFKHFPSDAVCPICGKSDDRPCFLVPIDGTEKERICEAKPVHVKCLTNDLSQWRYNPSVGVIYVAVEKHLDTPAGK